MSKTYKIHAKYWNAGNTRKKLVAAENVIPAGADHAAVRIAVAWARMHEFKPHKDHSTLGYLSVCRVVVGHAHATDEAEESLLEEPPFFEWYDHYLLDIGRFAEALIHAAEQPAKA